MPAARRNAVTELFFRIHPWLYRRTGGRILGRFGRTPYTGVRRGSGASREGILERPIRRNATIRPFIAPINTP
jgi:hypothetical protein